MIPLQELHVYKNFDELARDVLDLAKEIMPDRLIFINSLNDKHQIVLKLSDSDTKIHLTEGKVLPLNQTLCNRIDFEINEPLIYEDISREPCLNSIRGTLEEANINSYLGIPISLVDGERFGTLCVAHHEASHFDKKSIGMLRRIARMFSSYLDLERLAYRDSLTGLYNRQYLYKYFEEFSATEGVLFFLDLDGFKTVNDEYGHDTGDQALKEVALRLQGFIKESQDAFAVRLGGDEFLLNFPHIASRDEINMLGHQLINCLNTWDTGYQLSASIGIVPYRADSAIKLNTLLKDADNAMYRAKAAGKNNYKVFDRVENSASLLLF